MNPLSEINLNVSTSSHQAGNQRPQRSSETDHVGRFPDYCWFCKEKKAKRIRTGNRDKLEQ